MNKHRQNQLLDVLKVTVSQFKKDGAEASLVYKDGCIIATIRMEVCKECKQIHEGDVCLPKAKPFGD